MIFGKASGSCVEESRLLARFENGRAVYCGLQSVFLLRETRTRESFGEDEFLARRLERLSSCERKHFPTPPAPGLLLELYEGGVADVPMTAM